MSSPVTEVKPSEVVQLKRSRDALCGVIVELQEQIKGLREKLNTGTEQHLAETNKLNAFYEKKVEENEKLKEEIKKLRNWYNDRESDSDELRKRYRKKQVASLKEEIEKLKTSLQTTTSYWTDNYELIKEENEKLKEEIEILRKGNETYEDLLAGKDGIIEDEEEGLQMVMFEGKEYYVDTSDGDNDVYDTSHEIVGSWDGKKIIFKEDTENIVKDVVNDIIDEVLDKSLP